ncbi:MAG: RnfH family protein [Gammaproteobacteria bacterium]|nr:RnfH family protein [Gammaproteobacteria bacterium]
MNVGVAYADKFRQVWLKLEVPNGSRVIDAIEHSGLLKQFPEIDLKQQKVGIFGKVTRLEAPVNEGERIEIYREITADPEQVERRDLD